MESDKEKTRMMLKQADAVDLGKIFSNPRKVSLLVELSKGDMPKSKAAEMLGISMPTVNLYVKDLIDANLITEYPSMCQSKLVRMIKLTYTKIIINFKKMDE